MSNIVALRADGYIAHTYVGDQTGTMILKVMRQTGPLASRLRAAGQPVHILVDISRIGHVTTSTRKVAVEALTKITYDKVAIYGTTTFTKALVNLIIYAARRTEAVKIFNSKADALRWLGNHGI